MVHTADQCKGWRRVTSVLPAGVLIHRLGTGVQAIKLSPYRAGLAEPALQRFWAVAALPTCCCPLWLSPPGRSVGPGTPSEFLLVELGILCRVTRRTEVEIREAQERMLHLEIAIIEEYELTLPPASYPLNEEWRREEVRQRIGTISWARVERKRALLRRWVRRILTCGIWRK